MATSNVIAHKNLTDPQLHEPKGISAANEGAVYVANGVGSGVWQALPFGALNYTPMSTADITGYTTIDIDNVADVDYTVIIQTLPDPLSVSSSTASFADVDTNLKVAGTQITQLRTELGKVITDVEAIKTAFEDLRTNLITSGIISAPTP